MNIATLSSLINELIIKEGEVVLPRIGKFYYSIKQASFSSDGKEMLPPSKKILFASDIKEDVSNLPFLYSEKEGISIKESEEEVSKVVDDILKIIKDKEICILPEIGKIFFKDDEIAFDSEGLDEYISEKYLERINLNSKNKGKIRSLTKKVTHKKSYKAIYIVIACLILFILLVYIFREPLKPILEQIFYTKEELRILKEWGNQ